MLRLKLTILLSIVVLPTLTLVPLGSLWLWQHGLVLPWVIAAFTFTAIMYGVAAAMLGRRLSQGEIRQRVAGESTPPLETAAWAAIEKLIASIDPKSIRSRNDLLDVAAKTIEAVAREYHPTDKTPVWNFTVPEMLLLTERVSGRLRPVFIENIPLADQLSVGQMLRLYEWRSIAGVAENAYDIWRLVRALNPVAAVTNEARERVTKQILSSLRDDLTHRIIRVIVREIGSASIDLYSGRLRSQPIDGNKEAPTTASAGAGDKAVPLSRFRTALGEVGKFGRAAHALYRNKPSKK